jgi:hypothetical protein
VAASQLDKLARWAIGVGLQTSVPLLNDNIYQRFESESAESSTYETQQQADVWAQALHQLIDSKTLHHHACLPVSGHPPTR